MWKVYDVGNTTDGPAPKSLPDFQYPTGPTARTKSAKTVLETFQLFFTTVVMQSILSQTKQYAASKGLNCDIFVEEILAFVGLNIAMGLLRLPQVSNYWSTIEIFQTPWFPSIMPRDRFFFLLRCIHLVDNTQQKKKGEEGYDPLFKVRPIIDHLAAVFPQYYYPARELAVDEMMIGTRCRISFLQYLPKKPTKFGIKVWVNSESKTGYVVGFQVYIGAAAKDNDDTSRGLAHRVVMDLMQPFLGKGHKLFVDNFYTSIPLFSELLKHSTYATGTTVTRRKKFPEGLKLMKNKLPIGSYKFAVSEKLQLTACIWRDRRDVFMLSSMHNMSVTTVLKRPKGEKEKRPLPCPQCIADYNQYMGGVDLMDQKLSYYSLAQRKSLKWWKKVFWRLIDIAVVNSWIIFRANYPHSSVTSQFKYRVKLCRELVQPLLDLKASTECPPVLRPQRGRKPILVTTRLIGKHFIYRSRTRNRCCVCYKRKTKSGKRKDTKTSFFCKKCDVFLCPGSCFEAYHTKSKY